MHSKETEFEYFIHFIIIESFFSSSSSEKSNSIDEIFFSYIVLIDTLKSTNIQINRKEFGLACIVKKSLYSYWYFFHSVYKDGPTHWFDRLWGNTGNWFPNAQKWTRLQQKFTACQVYFISILNSFKRNLQNFMSISIASDYKRNLQHCARLTSCIFHWNIQIFVRVDITLWDYRNNALHVTVSWRLL